MNYALERVGGDYVLFLNAGDRLAAPRSLEVIEDTLSASPDCDLLLGAAFESPSPGSEPAIKQPRPPTSWRWGMPTHHQAMVFRTEALRALGGYDLGFEIAADYDVFLKLYRQGAVIRRVSYPICIFAPPGLSARRAAQGRREQALIRRQVMGTGDLTNAGIGALQILALTLRRWFPLGYQALRYRASGPGNNG